MNCIASQRCARPVHRGGRCHKHYKAHLRKTGPVGRVPIEIVRKHLRALMDAGMTQDRIAEIAGISRCSSIKDTFREDRTYVRARTAAKILAVEIPGIPTPTSNIAKLIPVIGTQRRLQGLVAIGYPQLTLAEHLGVCWQTVSEIVNEHKTWVHCGLAQDAEKLFQELELKPATDVRAIRWARKRNWALPMQWDEDDIDDPAARPHISARSDSDWFDEYCELKDIGTDDSRIAEKMGIKVQSLQARIQRRARAQ